MHINPEETWHKAEAAIRDSAEQLRQLIEEGVPLRPSAVTGGKDGVWYGIDALHPQYRRVQWKDVRGRPVLREALLPDGDTELDMDGLYKECIRLQMRDMEIVSLIRLYGVTSFSTGARGVDVLQNYRMDADGVQHILADREKKRTAFDVPRLGDTTMHPNGIPYRNHPKAVIRQPKPVGPAYPNGFKLHTVTDGGAVRKRRRSWRQAFTRRKLASIIAAARANPQQPSAATQRHQSWQHQLVSVLRSKGVVDTTVTADGEVKTIMSTKGEPGDDSVNAGIPWAVERCKYATFDAYAKAVDILVSSGVAVDTIHDDFESYYELFALGEFDKWYSAQIVSAGGSDQGLRCEFGIGHLPDYLNRCNFMMCDLIAARARRHTEWMTRTTPWAPDFLRKCLHFVKSRRDGGDTGDMFAQFPWFDDNVATTLRPITSDFRQLRYDTWAEFKWDIALPKAAMCYWKARTFEPTVGFEVRPHQRSVWLPDRKVAKYSADIDELLRLAEEHPDSLMPKDKVVTLMGRLASAAGPIPTIWRYFGGILSVVASQHFELWVMSSKILSVLLQGARHELQHQTGQPLTTYRLRPGADRLPVWQTFTDASRNTESFEGAAGGWFRLWHSDTVFFFTHRWNPAEVEKSNIGELEMVATDIARALQLTVHRQLFGGGSRHYLLEHGDSQSISDYVLNSARGSSPGIRFIVQRWAAAEDGGVRMCSSKQLHREFNQPADKLANGDIAGFIQSMLPVVPRGRFVQLDVPASAADLSPLLAWTSAIGAVKSSHNVRV